MSICNSVEKQFVSEWNAYTLYRFTSFSAHIDLMGMAYVKVYAKLDLQRTEPSTSNYIICV